MTGVTALIGVPLAPWQAPHTAALAATSSAALAGRPSKATAAATMTAALPNFDNVT
jgi:hypothetical protein